MPLPAALLAKLAKRGILSSVSQRPLLEKDKKGDLKGVSSCPNKSNIHHDCTQWCATRWKGHILPSQAYACKMAKLVQKNPLPRKWVEVFDKGMGCFYYWNMESDLVSWLPPKHPKSHCSESAFRLRQKRVMNENHKADDERHEKKRPSKYEEKRDKTKDYSADRRHRYEDKERSRKRSRKDDIDPMDPAAYSDVARGTWSDGLDTNKSGADSTASGVLYQQRPYPAPGDVLAANNKVKKK